MRDSRRKMQQECRAKAGGSTGRTELPSTAELNPAHRSRVGAQGSQATPPYREGNTSSRVGKAMLLIQLTPIAVWLRVKLQFYRDLPFYERSFTRLCHL